MQTEGKLKKKNYTRIKSGSNKTWVRTRTRNFFFQNFQIHTKMRFLALVKHYIINLEFLNSPFCSHKGPNES